MLEKMNLFFARRLAGYDGHMLASIEGAAEFYPFTAMQLPMEAGSAVLDLGCGTGLELEEYFARNPRARVTGIDLSGAMLEALAQKFPDQELRLIHGSYFDVPLGQGAYAAAVSVESLHHFPAERKGQLYRKLFHALAEGGYFILTDYFAETREMERAYFADLERLKREQGITDNAFYHYDTPLTVEHEREVLKSAGFSDVQVLNSWGATSTIKAVRRGRKADENTDR